MNIFKKILVPVATGSRHSLDAVHLAARLAKVHGAGLMIVHVVDELLVEQLTRFSKKDKKAVREELKGNAQGFLDDMRNEASKVLAADVDVRIGEGIPHEFILKEAVARGVDLIVMGKLGRRGIGAHSAWQRCRKSRRVFADPGLVGQSPKSVTKNRALIKPPPIP